MSSENPTMMRDMRRALRSNPPKEKYFKAQTKIDDSGKIPDTILTEFNNG